MGIVHELGKSVQITDAFSGEALENAQITLEYSKRGFLNKSSGFYALSELEEREYAAIITSRGYVTKRITFFADGKTAFVAMIPDGYGETMYLSGDLYLSDTVYVNQTFQYSLRCHPYGVRVTKKGEQGGSGFKLQVQTENVWQNRKILTEFGDIYTLDRFDFLKKEHKIQECFGKTIEAGELIYVLFEGKTDVDGGFSIPIPAFAMKEKVELLVYLDGKMQFFAMDTEKMKIVMGGE